MSKSDLERSLATQMKWLKLPEPATEYRFWPERRWRFDFAFPEVKLAVEVEGGAYSGGRHVRPDGFEKDTEKYNMAAIEGWCVLRFTKATIENKTAAATVALAYAKRVKAMSA